MISFGLPRSGAAWCSTCVVVFASSIDFINKLIPSIDCRPTTLRSLFHSFVELNLLASLLGFVLFFLAEPLPQACGRNPPPINQPKLTKHSANKPLNAAKASQHSFGVVCGVFGEFGLIEII